MHIHLTVSQEFSRDNPHFCLRRDDPNLPPSPQRFLNTNKNYLHFSPTTLLREQITVYYLFCCSAWTFITHSLRRDNIHMYLISVWSNTPQNASVVFLYRRPTVSVRGRLRVPHHHHDLHHYERVQVIITKPTNEPNNTNTMNSHVDGQPVLFVTFTQIS